MAKGVGINFTADADQVVAESKRAQDSVGDVGDTLEEMGDVASDAGDQVEDSSSRSADALDEVKDKSGEVGDALGDLGGAAQDALSGDLAGAAEGGLTALTGLAAAIPGVGAIAGTVFAEVGKGIIGSFEEAAEESTARVESMYDDMAKSGNNYLSETFLQQEIQEQIKTNYDRIAEVAKLTGLTEAEVARAMVTAGGDRNAVLDAANEKYQEQLRLIGEAGSSAGYSSSEVSNMTAEYAGVVSEFSKFNEEQTTAIAKSQLFRDATSESLATATVGVNELRTATESFRPIPISVDLTEAEAQVEQFLSRGHRLNIVAGVLNEHVY